MRVPLDVVGDIAILKFSRWHPWIYKKFYSWRLLKQNQHLKVILEKVGGFSGELRTQTTKWVSGEKRKDTVHRENDCSFYLDIDETYFSPRLSQERKIVAEEIFHSVKNSIKPAAKEIIKTKLSNPKILVMFGGVAPQAIVLAKTFKKQKLPAEIISSELNKRACEFAQKNVFANKVKEYVSIVQGDSRKHCLDLAKRRKTFDFILMLRPNLEDTFLDAALNVAHKGTIVYYHGFGEEEAVKKEVMDEIRKSTPKGVSSAEQKRKISNFKIRKAGDIGVNKWRWNISFKVL